jgi:ADP-heptose:LPS heptosyltransferase
MTTLVARMDNVGDVLLSGPAIRAVAATAGEVTLLVGPRGFAAADLMPGVGQVLEWRAPWIDPDPPALTEAYAEELIAQVRSRNIRTALVFTSFHQSALPLAVLLRIAGVEWIGAVSEDYPGSLLDLRHQVPGDPPEPERMLSLVRAAGYELPAGDDGRLAIRGSLPDVLADNDYLVVHPGSAAPARTASPAKWRDIVRMLGKAGYRVVVTGSAEESAICREVAGEQATNISGQTDLRALAGIVAHARVLIAGNTGVAHLAAAVGTPVVSLFSPVVPAARWAPYRVPTVLLGDQTAPCAGTRARRCPVVGHPCLENIDDEAVVDGVRTLLAMEGQACAT